MQNLNILKRIFQIPVPETLFHYTSSDGLIGIIENNNIWNTKINYLNDGLELRLAFQYIRDEIVSMKKNQDTSRSDDDLNDMLEILNSMDGTNVSITSFTAENDQLSQWRGYCKIGEGYSIGFDGRALNQTITTYIGNHLVPCVYEEEEHKLIIKELINSSILRGRIETRLGIIDLPLSQMHFKDALLLITPMIKDKGFAEEREWRLIDTNLMSYNQAKFRKGNFSIIPYWEFDIELFDTLKSITIGPTPEPELAEMAIKGLLYKKGLENTEHHIDIIRSKIPFRNI